jgi:O-antigen/teichoic acid export membrane protein
MGVAPVEQVEVPAAPPKPPAPRSLRKNFAWTLAGNVIYGGCQFLMAVVLTKADETPISVGQFGFALAVTAPVIMFSNLQLRSIQATDAKRTYRFGHYLALRLLCSFLALLVVLGVAVATGETSTTFAVICWVGLAKAFESISDCYYGLMQQHEHMELIAKSMIIKGPLSLAALAIGMFTTHNVAWAVAGVAVAWFALLLLYDIPNALKLLDETETAGGSRLAAARPLWDWATMGKIAWLALPLGFVMMLVSLNPNIPRYSLKRLPDGTFQLGIFTALANLMMVGTQIVNALGQAAAPRLAKYLNAGNQHAFRSLLSKLILVALVLALGGVGVVWLFGRPLLLLIAQPEYVEYTGTLSLLMLAAGLSYVMSMFGYAATALRKLKFQPFAQGAMCLATFAVCALTVEEHGQDGAAWSMVAAYTVGVLTYGTVVLWGMRR